MTKLNEKRDVIDILNEDENARMMLNAFNTWVKNVDTEIDDEMYQKMRADFVTMLMWGNKEAFELFASTLYHKLRGEDVDEN